MDTELLREMVEGLLSEVRDLRQTVAVIRQDAEAGGAAEGKLKR